MSIALERLLDQTATRDSCYGGGSASALTCAVAAALLEKLLGARRSVAPVRTIRARCLQDIERDAKAFGGVIRALRRRDPQGKHRALKAAIDVPLRVCLSSSQVLSFAKRAAKDLHPGYRSDLACVERLARAAHASAKGFVTTNLRWLKDPAYSRRIAKRLTRA